ncbi:MAG: hypothetical protein OJF48_004301 [Afipia sp.]|nr:MAG: hypothetical protein OJF48_004301 [Afipia sp.]
MTFAERTRRTTGRECQIRTTSAHDDIGPALSRLCGAAPHSWKT